MVSHDPDVAVRAERIVHMLDGRMSGDERRTPAAARDELVGRASA